MTAPLAQGDILIRPLAADDASREFPFGIFDRSDELLGGVGLSRVDRANNRADLGYSVAAEHRGKGVASNAARLAARMGFRAAVFTRLEIVVLADNIASHQVAQKLGAMREAEARNRLVFRGRPANAVAHSLVCPVILPTLPHWMPERIARSVSPFGRSARAQSFHGELP